jgi:phage replication O-like protein O
MANPDPENGHIDIPHELAEVLMKINITSYQYRILWLVWRKTYGWHKDIARISLTEFEKYTDLDRRNIARTIKELERLNIIKVEREEGMNKYKFNLDYEVWNIGASVSGDTGVGRDTTLVSKKTPKVVSVGTHIKEKKETTKKKRDLAKEIFNYYCINIKKLKVWNKKREKMICTRLKTWTQAELKEAIDGMANSKWHMENGQNSFELIFRNDIKVEEYIGMNKKVKNDEEELPWIQEN